MTSALPETMKAAVVEAAGPGPGVSVPRGRRGAPENRRGTRHRKNRAPHPPLNPYQSTFTPN
jgi:hypothetical protein